MGQRCNIQDKTDLIQNVLCIIAKIRSEKKNSVHVSIVSGSLKATFACAWWSQPTRRRSIGILHLVAVVRDQVLEDEVAPRV
jgi:hypothetical protein